MKIGLVTVNLNQPDVTAKSANFTLTQSCPDLRFVIVDNGSTSENFVRLEEGIRGLSVDLIRLDKPKSPGAAFNLGIKSLADRCDFVLIQRAVNNSSLTRMST